MDRHTVNEEVYGSNIQDMEGSEPSTAEKTADNKDDGPSQDMRKRIEESLSKVRPFLNMEGGDVEFVDYDHDEKKVKVRLQGACSHCAISSVTLKMGIEQTLMEDIPEIKGVIQVE